VLEGDSGQLHAPAALILKKEPSAPTEYKALWSLHPIETFMENRRPPIHGRH